MPSVMDTIILSFTFITIVILVMLGFQFLNQTTLKLKDYILLKIIKNYFGGII